MKINKWGLGKVRISIISSKRSRTMVYDSKKVGGEKYF